MFIILYDYFCVLSISMQSKLYAYKLTMASCPSIKIPITGAGASSPAAPTNGGHYLYGQVTASLASKNIFSGAGQKLE